MMGYSKNTYAAGDGKTLAIVIAALGMLFLAGLAAQTAGQKTQAVSTPTFYKDIVPILQDKCQSCHRSGEAAPMPLVTYDQTRPWAGKIAAAVEMKMMPPWFADSRYGHFANDPSLNAGQIATLGAWASVVAPSGNPQSAPVPRKWKEVWDMPQPDGLVNIPKLARIPAR